MWIPLLNKIFMLQPKLEGCGKRKGINDRLTYQTYLAEWAMLLWSEVALSMKGLTWANNSGCFSDWTAWIAQSHLSTIPQAGLCSFTMKSISPHRLIPVHKMVSCLDWLCIATIQLTTENTGSLQIPVGAAETSPHVSMADLHPARACGAIHQPAPWTPWM